MTGPNSQDDRPGSFSSDDWSRLPRPDEGRAPDAPDSMPGAFFSGEPNRSSAAAEPSLSVPSTAELLLSVPWLLWSLAVVAWLADLFFDRVGTTLIVDLWILSGLAILWPKTEVYLAKYVLRLRKPTMLEQQRLDAVWGRVAARAGVDPHRYRIWIEESDGANAFAMAGRTISVTRWALTHLPPSQLEAVLAHELGHHLGGHALASMVAFWYALPGRAAVAFVRAALRVLSQVPALGCLVAGFILVGWAFGIFAAAAFNGNIWYPVLAIAPLLMPIPLAWFSRRSELNADITAADLGYGRQLLAWFYELQSQGDDVARRAAGWRGQLYSTHPSIADRITALEKYIHGDRP